MTPDLRAVLLGLLALQLTEIANVDRSYRPNPESLTDDVDADYHSRNTMVIGALGTAMQLGLKAGIQIDPNEPGWPVVFIELPTGQVSWHVPAYPGTFDGHTVPQKYERLHAAVPILEEGCGG